MSTATIADPSTVSSITLWWRRRDDRHRDGDPSDCWWFSVQWDNYDSKYDPFPADLMDEADTVNDAVVLLAERFGVVIGPDEVVDYYPDRSARWQRED